MLKDSMNIIRVVLFFVFIVSANAFAEGTDECLLPNLNLEASGSFDAYSKYIWRGFALDADPVLQPGFAISGYGITFSFWSSWDFDNNDALDGDEIDYVIDYTYDFDCLTASIGHTYYEFPGTDTFSKEFYVGIGLPLLLSPSFTYYYDYGDEGQGGADGEYLALEVSHSLDLIEDLGATLDLSGRVAYNNELFIDGEGGDVLLSGGLTLPLAKGLSLSPSINYAIPYGDLDDSADGNQSDRFYYGFSLSYSF